jgi:RDD family
VGGLVGAATVDGMSKSSSAATRAVPQKAAGNGPGESAETTGSAEPGPVERTSAEPEPTAAGPAEPAVPAPRDAIGGWLTGPQLEPGQDEWTYKGERLGLPESGSGSLAGQGRRLGALCVDWAIAYLATGAFGWHTSSAQGQWGVIALFAAQMLVLESLLGYTIGKRIFGIRVGRLGAPLTPVQVIGRTVLLLLVIPAAIWDRDGRGMHDKLTGTVVINR